MNGVKIKLFLELDTQAVENAEKLDGCYVVKTFMIESLDKISYLQYTLEQKTVNIVPQNLLPHQKEIKDMLKIELR